MWGTHQLGLDGVAPHDHRHEYGCDEERDAENLVAGGSSRVRGPPATASIPGGQADERDTRPSFNRRVEADDARRRCARCTRCSTAVLPAKQGRIVAKPMSEASVRFHLVEEGAEQVVLRTGRDADLQHEQGDGDGEDAVAERFQPSGPQPRLVADRLDSRGAMIVVGAAAIADGARSPLNACSPRRRHIPCSAPRRR